MRTNKTVAILTAIFLALGMFSIHAQVSLGIAPAGKQTILYWPANSTSYVLQSTTNLTSPNWVNATNAVSVVAVTVSNTSPQTYFRLVQPVVPSGMVLIPAGQYTIGDTLDGESDATPTTVSVSAFYIDTNLISGSQWQTVYSYAVSHGYSFTNAGSSKATNHPMQSVTWYECVEWCNARSQQAGLTPVYYTDAGLTQPYTNDATTSVFANWNVNGYRLPTEAEWEKAARGGASGQRFPWGNYISEKLANYQSFWINSSPYYSYDTNSYSGSNTNFNSGGHPYTSPIGYFAPNGYGLYDMSGNVAEWCWDWYASTPYPAGSAYLGGTDPRGAASGSSRVIRGGDWGDIPPIEKCALRDNMTPSQPYGYIGFRCVETQ